MKYYCAAALRIWQHEEKRPANKDETQRLIQALYDDQEANPKQIIQSLFDLEGNRIGAKYFWANEINWILFSQKYPNYSFSVYGEFDGEYSNEEDYQTYFQGKNYDYTYQYFELLGQEFEDMDIYVMELFNPSFTLFNSMDELKSKIVIQQDQTHLKIYIPAQTKEQCQRLYRILYCQAHSTFKTLAYLNFNGLNIDDVPYNSPIQPATEIKYYLGYLEDQPITPQEFIESFIDCFYKIAEKFLIGELR